MDSSLFLKYSSLIQENTVSKEDIINHIKISTGISLTPNQIELENTKHKKITLKISSSMRAVFLQKGIHKKLQEIGFTYSL